MTETNFKLCDEGRRLYEKWAYLLDIEYKTPDKWPIEEARRAYLDHRHACEYCTKPGGAAINVKVIAHD